MGLLFFSIGIYALRNESISKDDRIYTIAVIERIVSFGDDSYKVYISYQANGRIYEQRLNSYSSNYYEGMQIEIYYDKNDPSKVQTEGRSFIIVLTPILGLVFIIISFMIIITNFIKSKKNKNLKLTGREIYATYISTQLNTNYAINGVNPYNIICDWLDPVTNMTYIFKSQDIWFNPEKYILDNNIKLFKVYINPNNMKEYVIDINNIENSSTDLTH